LGARQSWNQVTSTKLDGIKQPFRKTRRSTDEEGVFVCNVELLPLPGLQARLLRGCARIHRVQPDLVVFSNPVCEMGQPTQRGFFRTTLVIEEEVGAQFG